MQPVKPLREVSIYNNIMYALAGHVAEELGGKPWEQLIQEEILIPLGMNHTAFYHRRHAQDAQTDGYSKQYLHMYDDTVELNYFTYM